MEPKWLDAPFFNLVEDFSSIQGYFLTQAFFIAKIVMTLNLGFIALKYAVKGSDLKEPLIKLASSVIIFLILMNLYPQIIQGLNSIVFQWSYGSTYEKVATMIQKTTESGETSEFWASKGDKAESSYSDIIKVMQEETGSGNVAKKYVLDIFDKGTDKRPGMFIRPNAVMRLLMLTFENIWNKAVICFTPTDWYNPFPRDFGGFCILFLTGLAVIVCGILASLQYFICALEFTLITSVGCIMLPFMLWDGSKFLTEKFVGAIVGFTLKMLFVTLGLMLTINGYLALMVRPFDSFIDQSIYTVFVSLFYMMICQNGPALAVSLLTGTPQMSLMEGVQAAGAFAAAGVAGAAGTKAAASGAYKGGVMAKSAIQKASGAAAAAKEEGKSPAGAVIGSLGASAKDSVKSAAHSLGRSLTGGDKGGGNGKSPSNRFSTMDKRNEANANGERKTGKEFREENRAKGAEAYKAREQNKKDDKTASENAAWKSSIAQVNSRPRGQEGGKRYDGGTSLGQGDTQKMRTPGIQKPDANSATEGSKSSGADAAMPSAGGGESGK